MEKACRAEYADIEEFVLKLCNVDDTEDIAWGFEQFGEAYAEVLRDEFLDEPKVDIEGYLARVTEGFKKAKCKKVLMIMREAYKKADKRRKMLVARVAFCLGDARKIDCDAALSKLFGSDYDLHYNQAVALLQEKQGEPAKNAAVQAMTPTMMPTLPKMVPQTQPQPQEDQQPVLPSKLRTQKALRILGMAVEEGLLKIDDGKYVWSDSQTLLAWFCGMVWCDDEIGTDPVTKTEIVKIGGGFFSDKDFKKIFCKADGSSFRYLSSSRLRIRGKSLPIGHGPFLKFFK